MRLPLAPMLLVTLAACSGADHGVLEPKGGPGVTLVKTHGIPNDTARLSEGGVTADVTGAWSDQGESVEIRYRSASSPAAVPIMSTSTWNGTGAPASGAWDRTVAQPGNAMGKPLLGSGPLQLGRDDARTVQIEYDRMSHGRGLRLGDEVVITVPMPHGAYPVQFRVGAE